MAGVSQNKFRAVQITNAVFQVIFKWLMGVVIYKLIIESNEGSSEPSKPLLKFVFLGSLSFYTALGLAVAASSVTVTTASILDIMAVKESAAVGRKLRSDILEKSVEEAGGTGDSSASELIVKVKVIEDFVAFDEHHIFKDNLLIGISFALAVIFAWFSGVAATFCFAIAMCWARTFDKKRHEPIVAIEMLAAQVNARLLDVVKNGVKIKIMGKLADERAALTELEEESDRFLAADASLRFFGHLGKDFAVTIIPPLMALIGWLLIQNSPADETVDIASSVLVATLLMDEAHKALIHVTFVYEKKLGADEAHAAIDAFLGQQPENPPSDEKSIKELDTDDVEKGLIKKSQWAREFVKDGKEIKMSDVILRYPGRETPVLDNYSKSFERGKVYALVGESGSGKSTALKVIADLILPEKGAIQYWEGLKIAYVSQDQKLFSRTVRENVTYGANKEISDQEVWEALKTATMADWVVTLPNGLDTLLVNGEAGVSGGQLQRLNLAHLFCTCQDADLVILDEVLSALDPKSREVLLNALETFLQGKTALIITHHQEMLRVCDSVVDMTPSKVVFGSLKPTVKDMRMSRRRRGSVASSLRGSAASSLTGGSASRTSERSSVVVGRRSSIGSSMIANVLLGERVMSDSVAEDLEKELKMVLIEADPTLSSLPDDTKLADTLTIMEEKENDA